MARRVTNAEKPPAAREPMKIGFSALIAALETLQTSRRTKSIPLVPYKPFPGVIGEEQQRIAMDSDINSSFQWGIQAFANFTQAWSEGLGFMGYPYLAELCQRAEYRRPVEIIAEEMTRKWIKLKATGEDTKEEKLQRLNELLVKFKVREVMQEALEKDGFFGRAQIYIDMSDEEDEIKTPLPLTHHKIGKQSVRAFRVIEPMWTSANDYNSRNPLQHDYYRPQAWWVMGKRVHASRMLTIISRPVPDMLKPAYNFGGLSLSQMLKPYVDNWLRTRQSVSDIIHSFSVFVLHTNLASTITGMGGDEEIKRLTLFNILRDNTGLMAIDKETEDFSNVSAPLGSLDHLQSQAQEQMASVAGIPLVKYFGTTPSGLNASSDGEVRVFYDHMHAKQESDVRPVLTPIIQILQLHEWGEIDPEIAYEFNALWELDDAGKAGVRKQNADTDQVLTTIGAIDADDVRRRVAMEPDSLYAGLDLDEPAPGPQMPPQEGAEGGMMGHNGGPPLEEPSEQEEPGEGAERSREVHPVAAGVMGAFGKGKPKSGADRPRPPKE